ncbi:MAG: acetylxylan esterase [Kiritimatiellae bacterium]|nr:acetylxylan esterase [Kiritimatiellia bacterium]
MIHQTLRFLAILPLAFAGVGLAAETNDFFAIPSIENLPLNVSILSETNAGGVKTIEFFMDGAPFNEKKTRIHAFFSHPEKPGRYPAVLELHGSGLTELSPVHGNGYASNGFACLTIDWCGPTPSRHPPHSEFESHGTMHAAIKDTNGVPIKGKYTCKPETSAFRNGVMFVRRSVQFLKSRTEVDPDRLAIAGCSAGGFLTLLAIGHEPAFKAAAVKYGCGFLTMPGYRLDGYVVPLKMCPREEQEAWLAAFDSKHRLNRVKAHVLMLSGTDDIFFWMPMVLKTYREMTNPKSLLMLPNDNHTQVGNWRIPLRYFQSVFGIAPAFPAVEPPRADLKRGRLVLSSRASGPSAVTNVSFWVKRMPLVDFEFKREHNTPVGSIEPWREVSARASRGVWRADIAAPAEGEQIVAYAMAADAAGARVSSDTVELPEYPVWRADDSAAPMQYSPLKVTSGDLQATLSKDGQIVQLVAGEDTLPLTALTSVEGCLWDGKIQRRLIADGGWEFRRNWVRGPAGSTNQPPPRFELIERFTPGKGSIRWELEIQADNAAPWSAPITTRMVCPVAPGTRFWTPWILGQNMFADVSDAARTSGNGNPLASRPMPAGSWNLGKETAMPLASVLDEKKDQGISLILSPEDTLLDVALYASTDGTVTFRRLSHRLGQGKNIRFAMDIVVHEADWRGGLRWMTQRYPAYFDPPNPKVTEAEGCGAYSSWDGPVETERFRKMAFRVLWDSSFAWPFFGMFMPPEDNWTTWTGKTMSFAQMNARGGKFREAGIVPLNYFILSEFGTYIFGKEAPTNAAPPSAKWRDQFGLLRKKFADSIVLDAEGREGSSWAGDIILDPAAPGYNAHIREQAVRYMENMTNWAGLACDRLFFPHYGSVNYAADDGVGWYDGRPGRHYTLSFREGMTPIADIVHRAGKVIMYNPFVAHRIDYYKDIDGLFTEGGLDAALLGIRKPVVIWAGSTNDLSPDADAFFQRHLYLGAYPMAPFPQNDHSIRPDPRAEQFYLDYGPLLDAMRGKKWVLEPHCLTVEGGVAQANLFSVPGGYAIPITFAGKATDATVTLRGLSGLSRKNWAEALHPGVARPVPLKMRRQADTFALTVPLHRGCAMVRVTSKP